jgi:hypothetical protein
VHYRPVTDMGDFRVSMQEEELDSLREQVEAATKEAMNNMLRAPLERLREAVQRLHDVSGKTDREVVNKKTGSTEVRPPIFRDSVVDNLMEEINLLHDFAGVLPSDVLAMARDIADATPHPQSMRDDPEVRKSVNVSTTALLASIDAMLED